MSNFIQINPEQINKSPFKMVGSDWMLVTAEKDGKVNTMTASWGGLGVMWNKNVAFVFVRPQRYTKEFIDSADTFSLTFFDDNFKKQLGYLGAVSGRDEDKIQKAGLSIVHEGDTPYFQEGNMTIICKKLYEQNINPECFIQPDLDQKWYPEKDYHIMYIAQVTNILIKE